MTTPAPSLDATLSKIDALLAAPPPAPVSMTATQLLEHVASEQIKATEEIAAGKADLAKARLTALKTTVAAAKAIYDSGATLAPVVMFKDPWQTLPGEGAAKGAADPQQPGVISPTTDGSNVQFKNDVLFVTTEKGERKPSELLKALVIVAKASDASPARKKLVAKGDAGKTIIAKAGEATAILLSIATMFGIVLDDPEEVLDCEFRWDVSDTISALQSAAKLDGVMASMSAMMASMTAPAAPPPGAAPTAGAAKAGEVAKSADAWPLDMSDAKLDARSGLMKSAKAETAELYWGRDSGTAPKS